MEGRSVRSGEEADADRGNPGHKKRAASTDKLLVATIALAAAVILLGGLVLFLKLRPIPLAPSLQQERLIQAQQAVRQFPEDDAAHTALGVAYLEGQRTDDARAEFERALELDETNWRANLELGKLIAAEDPERATALLEISTENVPPEGRAISFFEYGQLLYDQGKFAAAKKALAASVAADSLFYNSHLALGLTYAELGQKNEAEQQYREALRLNPGSQEIKEAIESLRGARQTP